MTEAELKATIQVADSGCWALDYAEAFLKKINRLHQIVPRAEFESC
jgi:hypothetical protein